MAGQPVLLAADVGGSTSRLVLADAAGTELARVRGAGANVVREGPAAASHRLKSALAELPGLEALRPRIRVICIGIAGASDPRTVSVLSGVFSGWAAPVRRMIPDVSLPLEAAFGAGDGLLVLAGTGSVAVARRDGHLHRRGGLGPILGDEGSGHDLARRALVVAARAAQELGPSTSLLERFRGALGEDDVRRWPGLLAQRPVAGFFPILLAAAEEDEDAEARGILDRGAEELAALGYAAARAAGLRHGAPLATAGGVLGRAPVRERLRARLEPEGLSLRAHVEDPVKGAIALAARMLKRGTLAKDF